MSNLEFLDFDVAFQRMESGYQARVLNSPAGQATTRFSLPFSEEELSTLLMHLGQSRRPVRGAKPHGKALSFGKSLFDAAFAGGVRDCILRSLDEARRREIGLRIRLRLGDTPELNDLPWELLHNPLSDQPFSLSRRTPVIRYLDVPDNAGPLKVKPPLRVLVVISSPGNLPPLDVESEWEKLRKALGRLVDIGKLILARLDNPTIKDLQRHLGEKSFHILHFIGHGGFDFQQDEGLLLFTNERGQSWPVNGQVLGTILYDQPSLRVVVLNACEGGRTSLSDPFAGVAQSLVRKSIPAVVAMQFEVTDDAAISLAEEFYSALSRGYPVDAALAEARKALYAAGNELEWSTPVLYLRSPDGKIFDVDPAAVEPASLEPHPVPSVKEVEVADVPLPEPEEDKVSVSIGQIVPVDRIASTGGARWNNQPARWAIYAGALVLFGAVLFIYSMIMRGKSQSPSGSLEPSPGPVEASPGVVLLPPLGAGAVQVPLEKIVSGNKGALVFLRTKVTLPTGAIRETTGTGFLLNAEGYVLTTSHVLSPDRTYDKYEILGSSGNRYGPQWPLDVIQNEPKRDLLLLKFKDVDRRWPSVGLGSPGQTAVGKRLYALGFPLDLDWSAKEGVLSNKNGPGGNWATSVPLNLGDSGAPVFDENGRVVAIVVSGVAEARGIAYCLPLNYAGPLLSVAGVVLPAEMPVARSARPRLLSPRDGAEMDHYPRLLKLVWSEVPSSRSYRLQIELRNPDESSWHPHPSGFGEGVVSGTTFEFHFVGSQPGRWRVAAINDEGDQGEFSAWSHFTFVDAPRGNKHPAWFPFTPSVLLRYKYKWEGKDDCFAYVMGDGHGRWAEVSSDEGGCLRSAYSFQEKSRDGDTVLLHDANRGYFLKVPLSGGWASLGTSADGTFGYLHHLERLPD